MISKLRICGFSFGVLLWLSHASDGLAQVFRWVDRDGKTHYSSTPQQPGQRPAELPEIGRESINNRIEFLKDNAPASCSSHGGVDCSSGADQSDASVICRDGFTDSEQLFADYCSNPKLESKFLVEFRENPKLKLHREVYKGLKKIDSRNPAALVAELRNLSGVEARGIEVHFKVPYIMPRKFPASGPNSIPPYGIATYQLPFSQIPEVATPRHLAEAQLKIKCQNCLGIRVGKGR